MNVVNLGAGRFQEEEKQNSSRVFLYETEAINLSMFDVETVTFWADILPVRDEERCLSFVPLFSISSPSPHLFFSFSFWKRP